MKKAPFLLGFALATALSVPAMAMDPASTAGHGSAGLLIGDGVKDGVNFGLGLRGGYTLPMNVYLGGTFLYHFGTSLPLDASVNVYYFGFEGGYDIQAGPVVVRPYLGLGPAFAHYSPPSSNAFGGLGGSSETNTKFGVWPGVTGLYPIGNFFVGADLRVLIVSDFTAFSFFATGGMQF